MGRLRGGTMITVRKLVLAGLLAATLGLGTWIGGHVPVAAPWRHHPTPPTAAPLPQGPGTPTMP